MENITFQNLLEYLNESSTEISEYNYEESRIQNPEIIGWKLIGSLFDERIGASSTMYKPWTDFALGFYPYNICDIYKDDKNRIVLSYIELGGHFPFRRSFVISKNSPFIFNPIGYTVKISKELNNQFLKILKKENLTEEKIQFDLMRFKEIDQINETLNPNDIYLYRKHYNESLNEYYYHLILPREKAYSLNLQIQKLQLTSVLRNGGIREI